jgi:hypothetical protein
LAASGIGMSVEWFWFSFRIFVIWDFTVWKFSSVLKII